MRISAFILGLAMVLSPNSHLHAQVQDPGAREDAEAAREKLLKAEDELDNIQANSEATKTSVDGMKSDVATLQQTVTSLQADNASLRQQLTELQAAFEQYKDDQVKSRQRLIDDVAGLVAASKGATKPAKKKKDDDGGTDETIPAKTTDSQPSSPDLAPPPDKDTTSTAAPLAASDEAPAPPPKPQKGYYHVVAFGETLTMICNAYKENGVNVSVAAVRKANGLTKESTLKAGQKLFIPKPGT